MDWINELKKRAGIITEQPEQQDRMDELEERLAQAFRGATKGWPSIYKNMLEINIETDDFPLSIEQLQEYDALVKKTLAGINVEFVGIKGGVSFDVELIWRLD